MTVSVAVPDFNERSHRKHEIKVENVYVSDGWALALISFFQFWNCQTTIYATTCIKIKSNLHVFSDSIPK